MRDRRHHHNGRDCAEYYAYCPGGCVNHMQDEQHTPDCEIFRMAEIGDTRMHSHNAKVCVWSDSRCPTLKEERVAAADAFDDALEDEPTVFKRGGSFKFGAKTGRFSAAKDFDINDTPVGLTCFELFRTSDESGVSGTGLVLQGIVFNDGSVAVRWCSKNSPSSTTSYGPEGTTSGWKKFLDIHVLSHPTNGTKILFRYPSPYTNTRTWNQPEVPEQYPPEELDAAFATIKKYLDRGKKSIVMGNKIVFPRLDFKRRSIDVS